MANGRGFMLVCDIPTGLVFDTLRSWNDDCRSTPNINTDAATGRKPASSAEDTKATPSRLAMMPIRRFSLLTALAVLLVALAVSCTYVGRTGGPLVRADPRFDGIVRKDAKLEKLADGFRLAEGPVWNTRGGYLLFSDMPANAIYKWSSSTGIELYLKPSGYSGTEPLAGGNPGSNGLAFDATGRLIICEHGDRRVTRLEADGSRTILADRYRGRRFNSPNDLAFGPKGDLYFTDPPYGLPKDFDDPARELPFSGVYRLSANGEVTLLTQELAGPNGIAFSPSGRHVYISDTSGDEPGWVTYDVNDDGTLTNGRRFLTTPSWAKGISGARDGVKVDRSGNIFATGPGGVHVFAPDGVHLGSIEVQDATNLAWGDDGSMLYITSASTLYRIRTLTAGDRF
jgi:gluconolactonase